MSEPICFCIDVYSLFKRLMILHEPCQWRLFIDSSRRSLKAVLLHNGNKFSFIPIAHSTQLRKTYENMKLVLEKITYSTYRLDICGNFKMLGFLLGL